jgi:CPA2 family monovalent cation:H+ antiporter-2
VLVVVLSTLATGGEGLLGDLLWAVGKVIVFLVLLVPIGAKVLPRFFERVASLQSREIFVITIAAFALGTAYVSSYYGLSLALGAFVAGMVVSESDIWHQILGEIIPLRDVFAGLFFVSVGMLVDPRFVIGNPRWFCWL